MKNVLVFAGGSGSAIIQQALKKVDPNIKTIVLVNAYDDGKSTGVCRKVFDVLGPSDIRKNQYTQWFVAHGDNEEIKALFETRLDGLTKGKAIAFVKQADIDDEQKELFILAITSFFNIAGDLSFDDFNIMNIIYAYLFSRNGYRATIDHFRRWLNIEDNIVLNSERNLYLAGATKSGKQFDSEDEIVSWGQEDPIRYIYFKDTAGEASYPIPSPEAIQAIEKADTIFFSCGTQWSSLIPTYRTAKIKEAIGNSKALKYLMVNSEQDKDMIGISAERMLQVINKHISLRDITVVLNSDAQPSLKECSNNYRRGCVSLGNNKGRYDLEKLTILFQRLNNSGW